MTDTLASVGAGTWTGVCALADLTIDRGACALVDGEQVAIFRLSPDGALYAISNHDPFSGADVLSRGIVGSKGDAPKVASPMFKQSFDLRTGVCLDDDSVTVPIYDIRVREGVVEVRRP